MIAALLRWWRGRRLGAALRRDRADLELALHYQRNNGGTIDELRALICQREHELALHRMESGSGYRTKTSAIVSRWRLWGA